MSIEAFQILPITEEHIEGFRSVVDAVASERQFLAMLEAPPLEQAAEFVRSNLEQKNPQVVAVAEDRVIGWCDIVRRNNRPLYSHVGVLGMGILKPWRGKGVGRALLQAALAQAWESGFTRVELTVREDNQSAIALYEAFGFAAEGRHINSVFVDGQYENVLSMAILSGSGDRSPG
jgi:RimJ/RimL family protein N-acetyltransferase